MYDREYELNTHTVDRGAQARILDLEEESKEEEPSSHLSIGML